MINKIAITIIILLLVLPTTSFALEMPRSGNDLAQMNGVSAAAFAVVDAKTGSVLMEKGSDDPRVPASLTKLVTALVVLDAKPKLSRTVSMATADQTAGMCGSGGACIKSKAGVKFTVDGLFHAALIPSANNAANALARSTGLSSSEFVARMNKKAASLGAANTYFYEPTGLDPRNTTTALDYTKIVAAAFSNSYLRQVAALSRYTLKSTNYSGYTQTIKNTDKLLADADMQMLGAKTGYLDEAQYNFASLLKYRGGQELAIVVLGEQHLYTAFAETKLLASMAEAAQVLALYNQNPAVLGTTTQISFQNN